MTSLFYGGIEGGGTKFVCLIAAAPDQVVAETVIPTTTPEETLERVITFFRQPRPGVRLAALGLAMFGPLELNPSAPNYGSLLATPKPGWSGVPVVQRLQEALGLPVGVDTDVNGALRAECRWGAGRGYDPVVYLTVGTGIGGGAWVHGRPVHGLLHPEMGHLPLPVLPGDTFPGLCPFHGRCWEGLAAGPALAARAGRPLEQVPPEDPLWDLAGQYLGLGIAALVCTLSPRRVILGGGVGQQPHVLARARQALRAYLNGYLPRPELETAVAEFLVPPALGARAGVLGAIALAEEAARLARTAAPG